MKNIIYLLLTIVSILLYILSMLIYTPISSFVYFGFSFLLILFEVIYNKEKRIYNAIILIASMLILTKAHLIFQFGLMFYFIFKLAKLFTKHNYLKIAIIFGYSLLSIEFIVMLIGSVILHKNIVILGGINEIWHFLPAYFCYSMFYFVVEIKDNKIINYIFIAIALLTFLVCIPMKKSYSYFKNGNLMMVMEDAFNTNNNCVVCKKGFYTFEELEVRNCNANQFMKLYK